MKHPEPTSGAAFELVTLLQGFTTLRKRSGEIDGTLPVRAARYCGPVFEGSAAGFQITLAQPITIARDRRGNLDCTLTEPALKQVTEQVDEALERGIKEGLITRGGYWDRLLRGNAVVSRSKRLLIWTGHMIRPARGLWLLVGGAFNRRSRVTVVDHVVSGPDAYVPLMVEIATKDVGRDPLWMESELACVTPLVPRARVAVRRASADTEELRQFGEFFSESYFETKAKHPTAHYMRRQREHRVAAAPDCRATLSYLGPDVHAVGEFNRFITPGGFSRTPASPGKVQFGVVKNIAPVRWTWQGQTHSHFEVANQRNQAELERFWRKSFGDRYGAALDFLRHYLLGEMWDQPFVQFQPWVFARTPSGWSMLVDGVHRPPAFDGMRGVIATDWFFGLAMVYRIYGPSTVTIPRGAPMLRALPVTRAALALGMTESTL